MGVLVLTEDDSVELANAAAQGWLAELREPEHAHLPIVIQAVASRARRAAAGDGSGPAARARIRTASGRWLVATGSTLGAGPAGRAAVILEEARAPELMPLIADAYGLSARERSVTQLVAQGLPTTKIATGLYLSPYTVQDHLALHRPGPPQVHLRQGGSQHPRRARRTPVLRPLRAAADVGDARRIGWLVRLHGRGRTADVTRRRRRGLRWD
jgi:hypothetical protein